MFKSKVWYAGFVIAAIFALGAGSFTPARAQDDTGRISVYGEAEIRVAPDEVIITFGVETHNRVLAVAKTQNDERSRAVLALAEKHGIKPEHVKTDFITIEPRYEDYELLILRNFVVTKSIVFTLKDITKFEALLSDALDAGANYVYGIEFRTTELRKHRDQAREMAIKAAKEKATAMAAALDQSIGKAVSVNEDYAGWWAWYGFRNSGRVATQNVMQEVGNSGGASAEGGFAPGQIVVTARVSVTFILN